MKEMGYSLLYRYKAKGWGCKGVKGQGNKVKEMGYSLLYGYEKMQRGGYVRG